MSGSPWQNRVRAVALAELQGKEGTLERKLDPAKSAAMDIVKTPVDEATFRAMHEKDRMAKDKLREGIEGFSKALVQLKTLRERLKALGAKN